MITKQDFLDFCKAQGDALIDHGSPLTQSAYANCAIGSYYCHLHGEVIGHDESHDFVADLEQVIGKDIADTMGNHGPSSYRDLVLLLELEYEPPSELSNRIRAEFGNKLVVDMTEADVERYKQIRAEVHEQSPL